MLWGGLIGSLQYSDRCERSRNEGTYCAMLMDTQSVASRRMGAKQV